jgi:hypothetical protein
MSTRASIIFISVLSVALVALAVFSVISISGLNSDVDDLETTASALQKQAMALQESSSGDGKSSLKEVAKRVKKLEDCLPEIQTEINSLDLEAIGNEYYVSTGSQVSSYCSPVVYPNAGE